LAPSSPRRFIVSLRKTSPLDRVALAILLLGIAVRVLASLGTHVPYSGVLGFLSFLAIIYLVIRLIPWFRTRVMWPLRNRLIVAYVFIAVVPVILLFSMAGVGLYGLYLQLGAHLLHDDLRRTQTLFPRLSSRKRQKASRLRMNRCWRNRMWRVCSPQSG